MRYAITVVERDPADGGGPSGGTLGTRVDVTDEDGVSVATGHLEVDWTPSTGFRQWVACSVRFLGEAI